MSGRLHGKVAIVTGQTIGLEVVSPMERLSDTAKTAGKSPPSAV